MKKQITRMVLLVVLFFIGGNIVFAADVNLTIRNGGNIVFSGTVSLPTEITSLNDADGAPHTIDASSVLAMLGSADQASNDFSISNLTYFSSFDSLYLKCITSASGENCDNWQYSVNALYPSVGMDKNILSGGENIYIYFGPQNRATLSSESINTNQTLTVFTEKYDYQNNAWLPRAGVTVGVTQPDPNNPFSPIEIQTGAVDENGQAVFSSIPVGSYDIGVKEDFYFPTETLTVTEIPQSGGSSGSGSSSGSYSKKPEGSVLGAETKIKFDLEKAFNFLIVQQKENGSFGEDLYTDWVALTLASANYQSEVIKLIKYYGESKLESPSLTDYERRAMALMSLGLNPYKTNSENYIEKITASFDGKQFGDVQEDNDDIFALIVLQNAGYKQEEKMISDDISFILSRQKENGSWDESIDMTGASMEALSVFKQDEKVNNALIKAKEFLKQNQKDNGSWNGSPSSTAWAMEGILAMGEKIEDWKKNENTPLDYLASIQDIDGGIKNLSAGKEGENMQNKIWENAYVATALSGKTWNQIMQKFEKPKIIIVVQTPQKLTKKQALTATVVNAAKKVGSQDYWNIFLDLKKQKNSRQREFFCKTMYYFFSTLIVILVLVALFR